MARITGESISNTPGRENPISLLYYFTSPEGSPLKLSGVAKKKVYFKACLITSFVSKEKVSQSY